MPEEAIQKIKEQLARIEVLLENMSTNCDLKLQVEDEKMKNLKIQLENQETRIISLENANKWLIRTTIGAMITSFIAILFHFFSV